MVLEKPAAVRPHPQQPAAAPAPRRPRLPRPRGRVSTPALLSVAGAALVILSLTAGLTAAAAVRARAGAAEDLLRGSGPLAADTQEVRRSLWAASAATASVYLAEGLEPTSLRDRYTAGVEQAEGLLRDAGRGDGSARTQRQVRLLRARLPVYADRVETLRAKTLRGNPLGADAYFREASNLMHDRMLPSARELSGLQSERLAADHARARSFPWPAALLVAAVLVCLAAVQVWIALRTHRVFNAGLLAASVAWLVAAGWTLTAVVSAGGHLEASERDGSAQTRLLSEARTAAAAARAEENLALVAQTGGDAWDAEPDAPDAVPFTGEDGEDGLLAQARDAATDPAVREAVAAAAAGAQGWAGARDTVEQLTADGRDAEAVEAAIGDTATSATVAAAEIDQHLAAALRHTRSRFTTEATAAHSTLASTPPAVLTLAALATAAAAAGIVWRLREFR